jgi:hypothetical protein
MTPKLFLFISLFALSDIAMAENGCPDGMTPFQNGSDPTPKCYPIQGGKIQRPPNRLDTGKLGGVLLQ